MLPRCKWDRSACNQNGRQKKRSHMRSASLQPQGRDTDRQPIQAPRAKSGRAQVAEPAVWLKKASNSSTWHHNTAKPDPLMSQKNQDKYRMNKSMAEYSKNIQ